MLPTSVPGAIISFPMFGEGFAFSPASTINIFGLSLHWYGIIIAVGFLLAYLYVNHRAPSFGISSNDLIDVLIWAVPAGIIGARLYYVIFNFSLYQDNFLDVFKIWNGGIAIYGGVIGAAIAVMIVARVKKSSFGAIMDVGCFGLLIGQTIGRWGNFINREAFGGETDIFCKMGLTDASGTTIFVHPTFLYESLWNILGLVLLHIFSKSCKRRYDGQLFAMYLAWYGLGRMIIEGLRTDSLYIGNSDIRVSQLLAAITVVGSLIYLAINGSRPHDPANLFVNKQSHASQPDEPAGQA